MKKRNFCALFLLVLISLCSVFSLTGCGEKDPIVGKWYKINEYNQKTDELVYTITKNKIKTSAGKTWTWEYDSSEKVYKAKKENGEAVKLTFTLSEDGQTLKSSNGSSFYKK